MQTLAELLWDVRLAAYTLRPIVDYGASNDEDAARADAKQLKTQHPARFELQQFSEQRRPFYPASVYDLVPKITLLANKEYGQVRMYQRHPYMLNEPGVHVRHWDEQPTNSE